MSANISSDNLGPHSRQETIERIDYLANLQVGALDGEWVKIPQKVVDAAKAFVDDVIKGHPIFQGVFPTPLGGIIFDISLDGWAHSVEFEPDTIDFYGVQMQTDEDYMHQYSYEQIPELYLSIKQKIQGIFEPR